MNKSEINFEKTLKRLQEVVALLEQNDIEVDKALELFSEGKKLIKQLDTKIVEIEQKVIKINSDE